MSRLTEREAIDTLELNRPFAETELQNAIDMAIESLKKQTMGNEFRNEAEQCKLALFGVIRNSKVMPVGLAQGRSMEEINAMSLKTMEEVLKMCDFDKMKQFYSEAEEALAKMGGKE